VGGGPGAGGSSAGGLGGAAGGGTSGAGGKQPCNDDSECPASDACTVGVCAGAGTCSLAPLNIDDNNACTSDSCDPKSGVSHTTVTIDDKDACTIDSCDPVLGVRHDAFTAGFQCGTGCPGGFHPTRFVVPGPECATPLKTFCEPTCSGAPFYQCGATCPSGYHVEEQSCDNFGGSAKLNLACGTCNAASDPPKAVKCVKDDPTGYAQCGQSCPEGFHVAKVSCDNLAGTLGCFSCSGKDGPPHAVSCQPNIGSFDACTECPTGWTAISPTCGLNCSIGMSCYGEVHCVKTKAPGP
jgi:hypothetical protein